MGKLTLDLPDRDSKPTADGRTGGSYEFDPRQNDTIGELAQAMKFVGVFTIVAGIAYGVVAVFALRSGQVGGPIAAGIQCVIDIVLGLYLIAAAANFRRIVDTQGADMPNLMGALEQLRRYFTLQMVTIIIALVALVGIVVLFLAIRL